MRSLGSRGLRSSSWAPRNEARPFAFLNGPSDKSRWASKSTTSGGNCSKSISTWPILRSGTISAWSTAPSSQYPWGRPPVRGIARSQTDREKLPLIKRSRKSYMLTGTAQGRSPKPKCDRSNVSVESPQKMQIMWEGQPLLREFNLQKTTRRSPKVIKNTAKI